MKLRPMLAVLAGLTTYLATSAFAAPATVVGTFDASTDTVKGFNETHPAGSVTFTQAVPGGTVQAAGSVSGLRPGRVYVAVPYYDGACLPAPGVTAFPSGSFSTDAAGSATFSVSLDPHSINPVAFLDLRNTRSVSLREVLVTGVQIGPIGTPNVPTPVTEACDVDPEVS